MTLAKLARGERAASQPSLELVRRSLTLGLATAGITALLAVAFSVGPLVLTLNVLTLVGIGIVALVARSWI
jgi:hypothetical protein